MTSDIRLVFDPKLWGGKDKGDNSQFWKEAEILRTYHRPPSAYSSGGELADVRFLHDGRTSRGHFTNCMKEAS